MIRPINAIVNRTTISNPITLNPQRAYNDTKNYACKGEKLNINCNETRSVTRNGQKLDIYA